jgi:hypothetical protein
MSVEGAKAAWDVGIISDILLILIHIILSIADVVI